MLQLETKHQKIINEILRNYPYRFYAYGSRVKGTARKYSDLDLCYQGNLSDALVFKIEEEFKESDLPFIVELVSWKRMSPQFQKLIEKDLVAIN